MAACAGDAFRLCANDIPEASELRLVFSAAAQLRLLNQLRSHLYDRDAALFDLVDGFLESAGKLGRIKDRPLGPGAEATCYGGMIMSGSTIRWPIQAFSVAGGDPRRRASGASRRCPTWYCC